MRAAALVASPIGLFTCGFAAPLVVAVYGDQWPKAAPILTVLALYGIFSTFGAVFDSAIIASGRTHLTLLIQLVRVSPLGWWGFGPEAHGPERAWGVSLRALGWAIA